MIEFEAAEEIRRLLDRDPRFNDVSSATARRRESTEWSNAGYFSFERNGKRYFVTVECAEN